MDKERFDAFTRAFGASPSRRALVTGLIGGAVAGLAGRVGIGAQDDVDAEHCLANGKRCDRRKKRGKHRHNCKKCCTGYHEATDKGRRCQCRPDTMACTESFQCCSGVCENGTCRETNPPDPTCQAPEQPCNGVCVNTATDEANCGACGRVCATGEVCCGGQCVNLQDNENNCGACGAACAANEDCVAGICTCVGCISGAGANAVCQAGNTDAFCGTAGGACVTCGANEDCVAGVCTCVGCISGNGANAICQPGTTALLCGTAGEACSVCESPTGTCCGGDCVNTLTDENNCGACGTRCAANAFCNAGTCTLIPTCTIVGQIPCDGVCIDPQTDEANCGACGNACAPQQTCVAGVCTSPPA